MEIAGLKNHDNNEKQISMEVLLNLYIEYLKAMNYSNFEVINASKRFGSLKRYMGSNQNYSSQIGEQFLFYALKKEWNECYVRQLRRMVYVLNCLLHGERIYPVAPHNTDMHLDHYSDIFNAYVQHCGNIGNRDSSIMRKRRCAYVFFKNLETCGCHSISDITPEIVLRVSLMNPESKSHSVYKSILRYIYESGIVGLDYSHIVPSSHRKMPLPDIYHRDEVLSLENACDRDTTLGKRDYAIILMASRLKLRPSDIAGLKFDSLDFKHEKITLIQEKTNNGLRLPMLSEVKDALQDYIDHGRPEGVESAYVFLRSLAPYESLNARSIHSIIKRWLVKSGVNIGDREMGPRALRASGATHMINSGISYSVVSDSLGHRCKDVIRHYARIDVQELRKCADNPPEITPGSLFERRLKGELNIE